MDYQTCSMDDVIRESILAHPTLLGERMLAISRVHMEAAKSFGAVRTDAKDAAIRMSDDCQSVATDIMMRGTLNHASGDWSLSQRIQCFAQAAKLQCLSPAVQHAIVAREG